MITLIDASTLINLLNGGRVTTVLRSRRRSFRIGPIVLSESGPQRSDIDRLISGGLVTLADDDDIPASSYLALLSKHRLGPGETECLCAAIANGWSVGCDDRRARRVLIAEIGSLLVSGSIGLLRESVEAGDLTATEAFAAVEQARSMGGFLPGVGEAFFRE